METPIWIGCAKQDVGGSPRDLTDVNLKAALPLGAISIRLHRG